MTGMNQIKVTMNTNHNSSSEESDEECVENLNLWLSGPQYVSKDKKSYWNAYSKTS